MVDLQTTKLCQTRDGHRMFSHGHPRPEHFLQASFAAHRD